MALVTNRRSFLSTFLGAAAFAVAQRLCPAALVPVAVKSEPAAMSFLGVPIQCVDSIGAPPPAYRDRFEWRLPTAEESRQQLRSLIGKTYHVRLREGDSYRVVE